MPAQPTPFHELFREHLTLGTHPAQAADSVAPPAWVIKRFAPKIGVEVRIVGYWRNGERVPTADNFAAICQVLFGDNPLHAAARQALHAAWVHADAARGRTSRGARRAPERSLPTPSSATDWQPQPPFTLREGLAKLYVHQSANQSEEIADRIVPLEVTVSVGDVYLKVDDEPGTPRLNVTVSVAAAEIIVLNELNVEPVKGTTLGADIPHPNVRYRASWRLTVPVAADNTAGSIVLAQETLCQYRTPEAAPYGLRIELRCRDLDLNVTCHPTPPDVSQKQLAVLRRVVQRLDADPDDDTVPLARAERYRRRDP